MELNKRKLWGIKIIDILRHASIKETEVYAHLSKEASREAIEMLIV